MITQDLIHSYSDTLHNKKIALLGPLPPPLGGVSVHLQRVMGKLVSQGNNVVHWDTTQESRYRYFLWYRMRLVRWLMQCKPDHVVYHTSYLANAGPEMRLLLQLKRILGYGVSIVEHDCRHMYTRSPRFKRLYQTLLRDVDHLVLIGSVTKKSYEDAHIVVPVHTTMEAAFLPPDIQREKPIVATYSASLHAFLYNHHPVILANAFQLSCVQDVDLYGIDLCLHMIARIAQEFPRTGFVLVVAQIGDATYFRKLCFLAHQLQIVDRLYILTGQKELWPLLKQIDLFVRPTASDGASVSVQESLYFGTPVVASDVCYRPAGATLFASRNIDDFVIKVSNTLRIQTKGAR